MLWLGVWSRVCGLVPRVAESGLKVMERRS